MKPSVFRNLLIVLLLISGVLSFSCERSDIYTSMGGNDNSFHPIYVPSGSYFYAPNGSSAQMSCSDDNKFTPAGAFTIEAWVAITNGASSNVSIIAKGQSSPSTSEYSLTYAKITSAQRYSFQISNGTAYFSATKDILDTDLPIGTWVHVCGVSDGSNISLYINGTFQSSTPFSGSILNTSQPVLLASKNMGNTIDASIDEIRIWGIARTASQINESMHKSIDAHQAGLIAYYTLDNHPAGTALSGETSPDSAASPVNAEVSSTGGQWGVH
jgi:hypothetical protein